MPEFQKLASAIATGAALAVIVIILVAGGVGGFLILSNPNSSPGLVTTTSSTTSCPTTTVVSAPGLTTTVTFPCGGFSTFSTSLSPASSSSISSSRSSTITPSRSSTFTFTLPTTSDTTTTNALETFRGNFHWNNTDGPFGVRGANHENYTTKLDASGTFTVTVDLSAGFGTGNGRGSVRADTVGWCSGTDSIDYTFEVQGTLNPIVGNLTLFFNIPTPGQSSYTLNCVDTSGTPFTDIGQYSFQSVVPYTITIRAPTGSVSGTTGGTSYEVDVL